MSTLVRSGAAVVLAAGALVAGATVAYAAPDPGGVGAGRSPTPGGRFFVRERLRPTRPDTIYGPLAFGLSTYSRYRTDWPGGGQVGLHGTDQPSLIPGRISNGCIRLRNADVLRLGRSMPVGTPVLIR